MAVTQQDMLHSASEQPTGLVLRVAEETGNGAMATACALKASASVVVGISAACRSSRRRYSKHPMALERQIDKEPWRRIFCRKSGSLSCLTQVPKLRTAEGAGGGLGAAVVAECPVRHADTTHLLLSNGFNGSTSYGGRTISGFVLQSCSRAYSNVREACAPQARRKRTLLTHRYAIGCVNQERGGHTRQQTTAVVAATEVIDAHALIPSLVLCISRCPTPPPALLAAATYGTLSGSVAIRTARARDQ